MTRSQNKCWHEGGQFVVVDLGLDTSVFWTSSVVSCAVFDAYHHHTYTGYEYSA